MGVTRPAHALALVYQQLRGAHSALLAVLFALSLQGEEGGVLHRFQPLSLPPWLHRLLLGSESVRKG